MTEKWQIRRIGHPSAPVLINRGRGGGVGGTAKGFDILREMNHTEGPYDTINDILCL